MKLLVLGGTIFVGRHLVEAALARGHDVTLFNRGRHHPELFADVEKIRGDRDGDLRALRGRRWDAVVDTCGYLPRTVRVSADVLASSVDHYAFVSTVAVYDEARPDVDERGRLATLADPDETRVTFRTYGPLKASCERILGDALADRLLVVRPGPIVGPHDPTGRVTYWLRRLRRGGRVLAPGAPDRQVQLVDVRDLSGFLVRLVESRVRGVFNAAGPESRLTMQSFLAACCGVVGGEAEPVWVDDAFVRRARVVPFVEMPFWLTGGDVWHLMVDARRALASGLTLRPLAVTLRDTGEWDAVATPAVSVAGLTAERERRLLARWERARTKRHVR